MFRTVLRICFGVLLFLGVLYIGGYSWNRFKSETSMKDPKIVYKPLTDQLPDMNLPDMDDGSTISDDMFSDSTENDTSSSINTTAKDDEITTETLPDSSISYDNDIKITTKDDLINGEIDSSIYIDDKKLDMSKNYTVSILDWIVVNWHTGAKVEIFPNNNTETTTEIITTASTTENTTETNTETTTETTTQSALETLDELNMTTETTTETTTENESTAEFSDEVLYDDTLESKEELDYLISTINVVDKLPTYDDYDRTTYEKPVKNYKYNGKKYNRNNYAWVTSEYYNEKDNTYTCPYTGTIIKDEDDGKIDNDYGNLDYDHIVSLHTVERSCPDWWTEKEKNAYAYDQAVGVDVLNSANRSKSDKTPSEWLPDINAEDYCYHYLLICSKYELVMTQKDIDVCYDIISIALENGETVKALNNNIKDWSN